MGKKYIDADEFKKENERLLHCDFPYLSEETLEELIDNMPAADIPRWIPVTERLPEKVGLYPVTCLDGGRQIDLGQWCIDECGEGFWECDWCDSHSVIAWMLLPEPYKGGEEE